jgi:hypothetical protein
MCTSSDDARCWWRRVTSHEIFANVVVDHAAAITSKKGNKLLDSPSREAKKGGNGESASLFEVSPDVHRIDWVVVFAYFR